MTAIDPDLVEHAREAAARSAARSGVEVRLLSDQGDFAAADRLAPVVWGQHRASKTPTEMLRALRFAGNYVAGAYDGEDLVAFAVGFFSRKGDSRADAFGLHSHITGVHPSWQGHSVGYAVKQHQRAWALERGISAIEWTTDPLVRRNGFFNLQKLGAEVVAYLIDFYGELGDGLNAGGESDRVVVRWKIDGPRAVAAADGALPEPADPDGLPVILDEGGAVRPGIRGTEPAVRAWVPEDIVEIRRADPALAHRWRVALRASLGRALDAGYTSYAITRDGWYVLSK